MSTTPRDAISGHPIPERIYVEIDPETNTKRWYNIKGMGEEYVTATQLDSLLKERDALQARVKELEDGLNFWKSERDRIKAFLSEGDWQTVKSEQAWRNRALRAEQERDEAYGLLRSITPIAARCEASAEINAALYLVRRLSAGPEKDRTP